MESGADVPTYRSIVQINTQARKLAAYEKLSLLIQHLPNLDVDMTRVELMPSLFVEVDVSGAIGANQLDHFSLEEP